MEDTYISKSKNGQGLFTSELFEKGEKVLKISGSYFSVEDEKKLDEKTTANSIRFD